MEAGERMDGFLMHMLGVVLRDLGRQGQGLHVPVFSDTGMIIPAHQIPKAHSVLIEAVRRYPW